MSNAVMAGDLKVGAFAADETYRKGRTFEEIELTEGERKALKNIQALYDCFASQEAKETGKHSGIGKTQIQMLFELRGMKSTFDDMFTSDDAGRRSLAWQARLY